MFGRPYFSAEQEVAVGLVQHNLGDARIVPSISRSYARSRKLSVSGADGGTAGGAFP